MSLFETLQRKQNKASDSYVAKQQESQSKLDGPYNLTRSSINSLFTFQQIIGKNNDIQNLHSNVSFNNNGNVQTKLKVSQPDDDHEQEADRVAEQVIRMISPVESNSVSPATISKANNSAELERERNNCEMKDQKENMKSSSRKISSTNMYRAVGLSNEDVGQNIDSLWGRGAPLDTSTREFMESRFGFDFGKVRIHTDEPAGRSAQAINALAYTMGNDIVFSTGQYSTDTTKGKKLLAHELTHVLQQSNYTSKNHLYMKADPAAVAKMDAATILNHPDYIDNNLKRMEFFGAEMARLHYADGTSLEIGLVPRWIKPPLETVDYHSESHEFAKVIDPKGKKLKFVPHPLEIPPLPGLTFEQVIKAMGQTVSFNVEPKSGKIIPNHLNAITAPFLCPWLRSVEGEYVKNTDEIAAGMVKILNVQKLIVELSLFRATLGGPKTTGLPSAGSGVGRVGVLTRTGTVTVEKAIESGLVKEGGKLVSVLRAIQRAFVKKPPGSVGEGLSIVANAAKEVGLEAGVVAEGTLQSGYLVLKNVGGISTEILSTGEIIVTRGKDVLLRLIP